ncbi:MAG: aminoacyl-tRNA hydrolase [Vicinamibacteria bacterium]
MVVGLGNPGERYRRTRHNVGFMVIDELALRGGARGAGELGSCWLCESELGDEPVVLAKPLTFMNHSGFAVQELLARLGTTPAELAVVVDDWALELGRIRVRPAGSHGGHNGLRSLIDVLASEEFARVRCGIRGTEPPASDMSDYVLAPFPEPEAKAARGMVGLAADAVACLVREGVAATMNRYNGPAGPPGPAAPEARPLDSREKT